MKRVELYLVTGFLGAGKTTFLKNLARLLAPRKIHIIVNEFGKVGVDEELLKELGAQLHAITNGSIFCTCRLDQFEAALDTVVSDPPDALIVETSGLSDPSAIWTVLGMPRYASLSLKAAIGMVDATSFHKLYETAPVCAKQLAVCNLIVINKADVASALQLTQLQAFLTERYPDATVMVTSFGNIEQSDLDAAGHAQSHAAGNTRERDLTLQKCAITLAPAMTLYQCEKFVRMFIAETYRIKGFVTLDGQMYLVDCVGPIFGAQPWTGAPPEDAHTLVALAGKGMPLRKAMKTAVQWYPDLITQVDFGS